MTRDEFVVLLKQRCRRDSDTSLDARIISEMLFIQEQVLEGGVTLPWFLKSENLSAVTIPNEERVQIPINVDGVLGRDFLRETEDKALWLYNETIGKWTALKKDDYDTLLETFPTGVAMPKYYALDGFYFRLKPTPDAVYSLRIRCYLQDARLTSNVENRWLRYAADLMMGEVGTVIAAKHLRDPVLKAEFADDANKARARLFMVEEAREHANREYEMGDA